MENPPRLFLVSHSQGYGERCIRKCPLGYVLFLFIEKFVLPFHFAKSSVPAIFNSRHGKVQNKFGIAHLAYENVELDRAICGWRRGTHRERVRLACYQDGI